MGGEGEQPAVSECSSSGEEDGNEEWKAAINSVACVPSSNGGITASLSGPISGSANRVGDDHDRARPQPLKHFQIKGQKELFEKVQNTLVFVREDSEEPEPPIEEEFVSGEGGIRLFQSAPVGIDLANPDELQGPKKKPRLLPGNEFDEKSKEFKRQLRSVVVEGNDVLAAAEEAERKNRARREAREEAKKEAAKKEEQRVMELKKIRGERWLPCIARAMKKEMKRQKYQINRD